MSVRNNPFGSISLPLRFEAAPEESESKPKSESEQPYSQDVVFYTRTSPEINKLNLIDWSDQLSLLTGQTGKIFNKTLKLYTFAGFSATPNLGGLANVLSEIENLGTENEVPPTDFAFLKSRSVVGAAYGLLQSRQKFFTPIPSPVVVTDDLGGIRMVWQKGSKTVRANFGAADNLQSYTYFESDTEHGVLPLDGASLSDRLSWLVKR